VGRREMELKLGQFIDFLFCSKKVGWEEFMTYGHKQYLEEMGVLSYS
jgi:hypothetical protein